MAPVRKPRQAIASYDAVELLLRAGLHVGVERHSENKVEQRGDRLRAYISASGEETRLKKNITDRIRSR